MTHITRITTQDARFPLEPGEGVDAIHSNPVYSYAVTHLTTDSPHAGVGLAFTLGAGNNLVCQAIDMMAAPLIGRDLDELMSDFGSVCRSLADEPQLRWLGPHKGVVQLALSSIVNGCFDLWAKSRGVPLWRLLLDLSPREIVALMDLSYVEDVLPAEEAVRMLEDELPRRDARLPILDRGYPGYDTSVGWFSYSDQQIVDNAKRAVDFGFDAMKLKVGSPDPARDIARAALVRQAVGDKARLMVDANQAWSLDVAMDACRGLRDSVNPFWIEEPTHPDDILGHQKLAQAIAPTPIAIGEHIPHRVLFKNVMQARAATYIQVDAVRVAGVSEFLTVSLMARKFGLTVAPHVGDMGQIHQHLVLFNHIAMGHDALFLEYIPHLQKYFREPAQIVEGVYLTPTPPGASTALTATATSPA